jgi:hypothetical protein
MSIENEAIVRRLYEEVWNKHRLPFKRFNIDPPGL